MQLPLGVGLGTLGVGTLLSSTWRVIRRADRSLPRARLTAALVVAPTALVGLASVLVAAGVVAFVSDDGADGWFSGPDLAALAAGTSGIVVAAHLLLCAIGRAVTHPTPRVRALGRAALCLIAAYFAVLAIGLVWLPAIVLAFRTREAPLPGAGVRPAASAAAGRR